jgi:phage host-nuclease inhibitor protein Gam
MRQSNFMDDSKSKFMPTDSKLKRVEESNRHLSDELSQLKNKLENIEKSTGTKASKATDFMADISRVFNDDKSFIKSGEVGNDLWLSDIDVDAEYDFRVKLMEHDLQSIQAENNTLVQTVMRLKQEHRDRRSMHDEVSVKLINQDMNELKRDIQVVDDRKAKIEKEIEALRTKLMTGNAADKSASMDSVRDLRSAIDQLDQTNKVAYIELYDLKDKNRSKRKIINDERYKREGDMQKASDFVTNETMQVSQLRNKVMSLTVKLKDLETQKTKQMTEAKSPVADVDFTRESLGDLRRNNERLMTEMLRLNAVIREQKASEKSRMDQSLSMSAIQFNDQSFNQSFMSNFK